ncbi:hypothetical protein [Mycobacterium sp. ST-F2]|uniref:hypothetical protein n=1 Tax=Mycobacterium sp. ST-F2 TaxID=1490484 RepID=UPI00114D7439|nr:hypothetical protein [Mycobacterium sp. ST-F2]
MTSGHVMFGARTVTSLAIAAAVAGLPALGIMAAAVGNATPLDNGLNVDCSPQPGQKDTAICIVSGCPRVNGDYVVDALHWSATETFEQHEVDFKCINGQTARIPAHADFGSTSGDSKAKISVQACRKKDLEKDWCGPWADAWYTFPREVAPKPAPEPQAPAPKPDIQCPPGSPTPTVPAGGSCAPIPDVTNAIQASFGDPGLNSLAFNVTNTSNIAATCNYTATANSINPLVPKKTTRQFTVPANGNHTETFNGAPTLTTYNVTLTCKDASGKQSAPLGSVQTSVTW